VHPAAGEVRASPAWNCSILESKTDLIRSSWILNVLDIHVIHSRQLKDSLTDSVTVSLDSLLYQLFGWKALQSPRLKQWHTLRSQPCDTGKAQNIEHWHNTRCKPNSQHDTNAFTGPSCRDALLPSPHHQQRCGSGPGYEFKKF
jgi:hypothetical protein